MGREDVSHMMARVEVGDFDTWLETHLGNTQNRLTYGMVDGPIYRDIQNPNAVLVHIVVEDMARSAEWFQSQAFKEANERSTTVRREFYIAEKQES
jgi:heme-degrading monooxygenase HmoA